MGLNEEIKENAKKVHTNEMKMSIGEIINLYSDGDIIIRPEFQRLFRWEIDQKSKFIESILIGIPIPPIFVQQLDDGRWEVIDGLQRLSTILEFVGVLKDEKNENLNAVALQKTKYLPSLENMYYDNFEKISSESSFFDRETKLVFKRATIIVEVIKRESDISAKYELFDRLNSGGSKLTEQEIRTAVFMFEKPSAISLIKELSKNQDFADTVKPSEKLIEQAYDEELVLRFFAYSEIASEFNKYNNSIKDFLDGYITDYFKEDDTARLRSNFEKFFSTVNLSSNASFSIHKKGFSITKYEALIIGLMPHLNTFVANPEMYRSKIQDMQNQVWFRDAITGNSYARNRLKVFNENAPKYFEQVQ
jgi:uncharacterized protein with ParB-like and HNH nuclease domain